MSNLIAWGGLTGSIASSNDEYKGAMLGTLLVELQARVGKE